MEKLAWAAGASKGYLSRVESGQSAPSLVMLRALAVELGVEPWQLLVPARTGDPAASRAFATSETATSIASAGEEKPGGSER